jgi:hypothetical protein
LCFLYVMEDMMIMLNTVLQVPELYMNSKQLRSLAS